MAVPPSQDSPPSSDSGSDYSGEPSAGPSQSDHDKYQQPPPSSSTNESSNSGLPVLPWIPSSAVTSHHHYGGLNPENLATLDVVNAVPAPDQQLRLARLKYLGSSSSKNRIDTALSERPMQGSQIMSPRECPNPVRNGLEDGCQSRPYQQALRLRLSPIHSSQPPYPYMMTPEADIFSQIQGVTTLPGQVPAFAGCWPCPRSLLIRYAHSYRRLT